MIRAWRCERHDVAECWTCKRGPAEPDAACVRGVFKEGTPERALLGAVEKIAQAQPRALSIVERNGFVFDDIGSDPGNWQHLAFTLYTEICEIDLIARTALGEVADADA